MTEIILEITEDEVDGGYSASALGHGIHTQGDSVEEIRSNVKGGRRLLLRRHHAATEVDPVALRAETRFSWHVVVPQRERRDAASVASTSGVRHGATARLSHADHDVDQR